MIGWRARLVTWILLVAIGVTCAPSPASIDRLFEQAQNEMRRGRVDEAFATATEGLARAEEVDDVARSWRFRLLVADVHLTRLEFPAALAILEQPIPGPQSCPRCVDASCTSQARARVAQGQLGAAAPLIDQAKPLAGGDAALASDLELLESQVLYRTGRANDADALLASARTRVAREGDSYRLAQLSIATGMGLVTRGRFDEALPHFDRVIGDAAVAGTTVQGLAFNNAGLCHARLGQFERAVTLQQQAIAIQVKGRKQNHCPGPWGAGQSPISCKTTSRAAPSTYSRRSRLPTGRGWPPTPRCSPAISLRRSSPWAAGTRRTGSTTRRLVSARRTRWRPRRIRTITRAQVAAGRIDLAEARRLFEDALTAPDAPPGVRWMALDGLGRVAAANRQPADAARHFEAALHLVEQTRSALLRADYRISFTSRLQQFYRGYVDLLLAQGQVERRPRSRPIRSRARVLAERQGVAVPAGTGDGGIA